MNVAVKNNDVVSDKVDMEELVSFCKRKGFIFRASDIYGGINGFWDYGPLGTSLKNNLRDAWWNSMVNTPPIGPDGEVLQIVGLDSSIVQNPKLWEASGHLSSFSDPMVDCRETKRRYRADHLIVLKTDKEDTPWFAFDQEATEKSQKNRVKKMGKGARVDDYTKVELPEIEVSDYSKIIAPEATEIGTFTDPKEFNLMFKTYVGATASDDNLAYLRPETAQGIFANFKNVTSSSRVKVPFGIAQVGKSFRNEVTPRNFIFRSREFEQMELEWFCHEDDAKKWHDFWIDERKSWWKNLGVSEDNILMRKHDDDELAHYSKEGHGTVDIEFKYPFTDPDFGELEGVAHRGNYDLSQHQEFSGLGLEYFDPYTNEKYIPHVIEPAAGLTRGVLAILVEAYTKDESRPSKMYMNFAPELAPVKAAILPLTAKDGQPEIAQKIYMDLRKSMVVDMDIKQSIGKRYARHDEIGTLFCITIDSETSNDNAVTVRHRNTMQQERVSIDKLQVYLFDKMDEF